MGKAKSYKSWTISDAFWETIKDEIPERRREQGKVYKRKPGGGRKPLPRRQVLEGISYVLRTGCQWKAVPREYGAGSSIHKYFQEWAAAGFFERIWAKGLERYDELEGTGWEWQSVDGSMVKAPLALEAVGHNPTDRGKMGTERSVLVDGKGIPLSVVLGGANRHDIKLLQPTLDISPSAVRKQHRKAPRISAWMRAIPEAHSLWRQRGILPISGPEGKRGRRSRPILRLRPAVGS